MSEKATIDGGAAVPELGRLVDVLAGASDVVPSMLAYVAELAEQVDRLEWGSDAWRLHFALEGEVLCVLWEAAHTMRLHAALVRVIAVRTRCEEQFAVSVGAAGASVLAEHMELLQAFAERARV